MDENQSITHSDDGKVVCFADLAFTGDTVAYRKSNDGQVTIIACDKEGVKVSVLLDERKLAVLIGFLEGAQQSS